MSGFERGQPALSRRHAGRGDRYLDRAIIGDGHHRRARGGVPDRDLAIYDDVAKAYAVDPGRFEVQIGGERPDLPQRVGGAPPDTSIVVIEGGGEGRHGLGGIRERPGRRRSGGRSSA